MTLLFTNYINLFTLPKTIEGLGPPHPYHHFHHHLRRFLLDIFRPEVDLAIGVPKRVARRLFFHHTKGPPERDGDRNSTSSISRIYLLTNVKKDLPSTFSFRDLRCYFFGAYTSFLEGETVSSLTSSALL